MDYLGRPSVVLPLILSIVSCVYVISLAVYRLYFHPLAKFPGPKLAALSRWYEFYYEVPCKGQFTFHIQNLHEKYGPIIRIAPEELHVRDSDYWDTLYSRTARLDRYEWMSGRMAMNGAIFTTSKHDLHRLRKSALNPLFSKRSILKFQPIIRDYTEILCRKFAQYHENDQVLPIAKAFSAFAGDIITQYSFGWCYGHLESPDFSESFHEAFMAVSAFSATSLQFPWIMPLLNSLPDNIAVKFNPPLHMLLVLRRDLKRQIGKIVNGEKESKHPTIFQEVLDSDLPQHEKTLDRLEDEAFGIMGAGTETTAWALTTAVYYIVSQPVKMKRLQDELKAALPDTTVPLDWLHLEKLPYLSACLTEAVRMSYGVVSRLPRISPNKSMNYKDWEIPANTPVSMTIIDVHHDPAIFPSSQSFIPERWLDAPKTRNGSSLDRYFVSFGKDARSCLGINLAHAELYMVLAAIFRRFSFELYETDVSDLEMMHDFFIPSPKLDSKGVRVRVMEIRE